MKCRIQMSYIIPKLEAPVEMDKYRTVNAPLCCAEDIVHAKLRVLNPERIAADAITNPANELSLADQDMIIALGRVPGDPVSTEVGFEVQWMAACDQTKPAFGKIEQELGQGMGLLRAKLEKGNFERKSKEELDAMPVPEKMRYDSNMKMVDSEQFKSDREAYNRQEAQVATARQDVTDAAGIKEEASRLVYKYLQTLTELDLTGEKEARAGKDEVQP
jgi:hypothetical protein